ncbi:MAG: FAD-dependent oxidoreductase [Anaerolineae bacterium]|nr:FAD-dependent oxidoreductase [Anaerolineae bacterium]
MEQADVIIIGSGQGGVPLATDLAQQGQSVVLFERGPLGGSCVNFGCTPSKVFLASAHAASQIRSMPELGLQVQVEVDFPAVMERVRGMINSFNEGVTQGLGESGVRVVKTEATFTGERTVTGNGLTVQAPTVIINTGKSPLIPKIPGLADTPYLTSQDFWGLTELPPRMLVLGGGYVGLELGQGIAQLGSETHIIDRENRIISAEETEVSETLTEALEADGVRFYLNTEAGEVIYKDGVFTLTLSNGDGLEGEALLVAIGRKPNTEALKPEAGGIGVDQQGHIKVDEHFRTNVDGVYAIGDVTGQPAFTHVSWEDYRRLRAILNGEERRQGDRVLGYAFFTEPQVGRVGLTLAEAKQAGYKARAVTMPLEHVTRAIETGYERGFYRMVIDEETDQILGATLVGPETAELAHIFIAHMEAGSTWQVLERSVHIHPAYAEALPGLARMLKNSS